MAIQDTANRIALFFAEIEYKVVDFSEEELKEFEAYADEQEGFGPLLRPEVFRDTSVFEAIGLVRDRIKLIRAFREHVAKRAQFKRPVKEGRP